MQTAPEKSRTTACPIEAEATSNKAFFENADKPTLHALSYALRHPDTWPADFEWDYAQCSNCAMGLARSLWHASVPVGDNVHNVGSSRMAKAFGISFQAASRIFFGQGGWAPTKEVKRGYWPFRETHLHINHARITPEMVADQIDKYFVTAE